MLRVRPTTALLMVGAAVVGTLEVALKQHVGDPGFVFDMEGARGVRWKDAQGVQKVGLAFASLTEEEDGVSLQIAGKVLKVAPCFAKHMEGVNGAYLLGVPRVLRGVHRCVRDMVGVRGVCMTGVEFARRVFMGALTFVLLMEVGRGVLFQDVQRVHVAALIAV